MGSWNATCGVSNLPILEEDKVLIFILEGKHNNMALAGDGICESDTLYDPILPLVASYCDYGRFKIISNENEKIMFDYIRAQFKRERYICSKEGFNINNVNSMNDIVELIKDGYIEKRIGFSERVPIGYMVVHQDVYNNLMSLFILEEEYSFERNRINRSYDYTIQEAKEREENLRECLAGSSQEDIRRRLELSLEYAIDFSYVKNLKDLIKKIYLKEIDEKIKEEIIRLAYFKNIMSSLRKMWIPQSGCGSQSSYNSLYVKLSDVIIKKCNKYEEECEW